MKIESERTEPATPKSPPTRSAEELDREPGSNRGRRGQLRESENVARSAEETIHTLAGHDDPGKSDQSRK